MPQVQVVAHRGSSGTFPEHTLLAFEAAISEGVDALECDVRLTRDGILVCVHDRRVDRTSDGRGVVSALELADLSQLDFASWYRAERRGLLAVEEPDRDAGRVLTLERLLQLLVDTGRPVRLQVEVKHPTRHGGRVEQALLQLLARYGLAAPATREASRVSVLSYALSSLRRVHALAPQLPTVLNTNFVLPWLRSGWRPSGVTGLGLNLRAVRSLPEVVGRVHARGGQVQVFTADHPSDIDFLIQLGVDAIISNHPRRVLAQLGRAAAEPDGDNL